MQVLGSKAFLDLNLKLQTIRTLELTVGRSFYVTSNINEVSQAAIWEINF